MKLVKENMKRVIPSGFWLFFTTLQSSV